MPKSTTTRVCSKPIKNIENRTSAPITAPHCLLVQVAITFLSLKSGSSYRDFDVLYGHPLIPEHPPDVLPGARRELGVIVGRRNLYPREHDVGGVVGGERDGRGFGTHLPGRALGEGLDGVGRYNGLPTRRFIHHGAPRDPASEGDLPEQQQQRYQGHEGTDHGDHDPRPRREGGGREVAKRLDRTPVPRVLVYEVRRDDSEGYQQQQHGHHHEQQGQDQKYEAVESVHCTLVFVCLGSASTRLTLSLRTGRPLSERCLWTAERTSDLMVSKSSPRRTLASRSTWAPGLRRAFTPTEEPRTSGSCSATVETSSSTTPRVM